MPRNMSFAMTVDQVRNKTKTVTRRFGWDFLQPGDILHAVEKGMGIKKGEKIKRICKIRIIGFRKERLCDITQDDVIKEGFESWDEEDYINLITDQYNVKREVVMNRIEFEYV